MQKLNLKENKICKGYYIKENEKRFCFFKKISNDLYIDVITNEEIKLNKFDIVEYDYNLLEYKHCFKYFKNNKDYNIFLVKDIDTIIKNQFFNKILRFFDLEDYKIIYEKNINPEILNKVITKVQKYSKRYIGFRESINYAKQLNCAETILEILTFLPHEFIEKITPFWIDILKNNSSEYFSIFSYSIEEITYYNNFNLSLFLNFKDKNSSDERVMQKIQTIRTNEENLYLKNCSDKVYKRLQEARITLENELVIAKETNDEDLIFEINIISDELQKIEDTISNLNFYEDVITWWPELLYPVPFVDRFVRNEDDVFLLERIKDYYPKIL